MTPSFNERAFVKATLESIIKPSFYFHKEHVDQARQLLDKFNADNWGRPPVTATDDGSDGSRSPTSRVRRRAGSPRTTQESSRGGYRDKQPPASHPIWGEEGIMHGMALRISDRGGRSKILNTKLRKRSADVFGHNKLQVGQWFPSQMVALFNGAHGHPQAGIYNNVDGTGAYSIVISGAYEDLDQDRGETVYYSGSGSHDNEDPKAIPPTTAGTRALSISLSSGKPVRVLRSYKGKSRFAPSVGLRYDGLYHVVDALTPRNTRGGLYEQFKLVRMEGQTSLEECRRAPSGPQVRDYHKINDGF